MAAIRESGRVKDVNARRVLDDAARHRRAKKALEGLEQDNFHDDPHADLVMSKRAPKFQETLLDDLKPEGKSQRRKKARSLEYFKQRFRKNFSQLLEEELSVNHDPPNYISAQAPSSKFPDRHFCNVCGCPTNYTYNQCGIRFCCVKCLGTHQDTRCMKWTA